ncbi:hypothetical protein [Yinghuangia soli]|uniref:Uncharacterized protein n=1 Tax=Yinghuangia soli TaxID=2908204 RepID=A0AA41Q4S1_9ACTN|nr:hypothetical protein [Yinghuangia soli]MCF2530676.1 hypothetical protein [Yinghuangia soli]
MIIPLQRAASDAEAIPAAPRYAEAAGDPGEAAMLPPTTGRDTQTGSPDVVLDPGSEQPGNGSDRIAGEAA